MRAGKVNDAVSILLDRKGVAAVLRSLDYILSRCGSDREVRSVLDRIDGENLIIMIQLIFRYSRRENAFRVFRFTRFEKLRIHEETESEMRRRKSGLPVETRTLVLGALRAKLEQKLKGRSGKVYLDPKIRGITLPSKTWFDAALASQAETDAIQIGHIDPTIFHPFKNPQAL